MLSGMRPPATCAAVDCVDDEHYADLPAECSGARPSTRSADPRTKPAAESSDDEDGEEEEDEEGEDEEGEEEEEGEEGEEEEDVEVSTSTVTREAAVHERMHAWLCVSLPWGL